MGVTASSIAALAGGVFQVNANSESDLEWTAGNTRESDGWVAVNLEIGYYGSELTRRWIDGKTRERWAHYLEATFLGKDTYDDSYNIYGQSFETSFTDKDTEHNAIPKAGAAAWPNPPGGNWGKVLEVIIKESLRTFSKVADFAYTADEIRDAYEEEDFSTNNRERIDFSANYSYYTRSECSHSVRFVADQVPDRYGCLDVAGAADETQDPVESNMRLFVRKDDIQKPKSSSDSSSSSQSSTPYMDMFDSMSHEELKSQGIQRVPAGESAEISPHDTHDSTLLDRPTYITSFEPKIHFGGANSKPINTRVRDFRNDSNR